jgi:hypothetical protein
MPEKQISFDLKKYRYVGEIANFGWQSQILGGKFSINK